MASHVAVMNQGRVQQFGTPADLVDHPATAFVATFVGTPANNMVPVVRNGTGYRVGGRHMPLTPPADECQAMYRAESMTLSEKEGETTLPMELVETSTIAGRTMVTGLAGGLRLTAVVDRPPSARIGDTVQFCLPAEPDSWFSTAGERIV